MRADVGYNFRVAHTSRDNEERDDPSTTPSVPAKLAIGLVHEIALELGTEAITQEENPTLPNHVVMTIRLDKTRIKFSFRKDLLR